MKKCNIEATDENILNSIRNDKLQRSLDVKDFLMMIDTIDYNAFISVDATWGDGKTFFVRQTEMTMKYYNKKEFEKEITEQELQTFQANGVLENLELKHTYLPIYFDAWLYDNHANALMALLMVVIKQSGKFVNTTLTSSKVEKITAVLDSIQFWKSDNWSNLSEKFKGKDILEETLLLEDIRQMVKEIFEDILAENAEKLVVFIDELDRCRPTFAIEILESVKHYFDDEKIIFVMSVNKAELIHTISKYYGNEFNSSVYLNKFFDISFQLPKADANAYFNSLGISCGDSYYIKKIASELQKYYSMSLRDSTKYLQKIGLIHEKYQERDDDMWRVMVLFIPVLCALDIVNVTKQQKLLSGDGFNILEELIENNETMRKYVLRLGEKSDNNGTSYSAGLEELKRIYEFGFGKSSNYGWYTGRLIIQADLRNLCLRICNSV